MSNTDLETTRENLDDALAAETDLTVEEVQKGDRRVRKSSLKATLEARALLDAEAKRASRKGRVAVKIEGVWH